ncbi:hypothetical protein [Roseibium sp.]|uniref:hypothetical protein n=1 Tax=Roseibium sp. TaxID=1936156 RepID=UPI00326582F4
MSEEITRSVIERGDLAHLALFLWAVAATTLAALLIRELTFSNRRFTHFVDEIARLNRNLNQFVNLARRNGKSLDRRSRNSLQATHDAGEKTD